MLVVCLVFESCWVALQLRRRIDDGCRWPELSIDIADDGACRQILLIDANKPPRELTIDLRGGS
jgi:hypothetical protein